MEHSFISSSRACSPSLSPGKSAVFGKRKPTARAIKSLQSFLFPPRFTFFFFSYLARAFFFSLRLSTDWMNSPVVLLLFLDINRRRIAVEMGESGGTFSFTGFNDSICSRLWDHFQRERRRVLFPSKFGHFSFFVSLGPWNVFCLRFGSADRQTCNHGKTETSTLWILSSPSRGA